MRTAGAPAALTTSSAIVDTLRKIVCQFNIIRKLPPLLQFDGRMASPFRSKTRPSNIGIKVSALSMHYIITRLQELKFSPPTQREYRVLVNLPRFAGSENVISGSLVIINCIDNAETSITILLGLALQRKVLPVGPANCPSG